MTKNPDEFPAPYVAVVPPSAGTALGYEPSASVDQRAARRAVVSDKQCFTMSAPTKVAGLELMEIKYNQSLDVSAEVDLVVAALGGSVTQEKGAELTIHKIHHELATPIPDPTKCSLSNGEEFEIFTRQSRAERVTLSFKSDTGARGQGTIPVGESPVTVTPSAGWSSTNGKLLTAANIVLAALPACWKVELKRGTLNLG
ncbi:MAG: hypothetical protein ACPG4T_21580, partial [Nannocystaceae bacterium]